MTRVLLTNDDGVSHPGLVALRASLIGVGLRVTTMAPTENRSGVARAVTVHGPVAVHQLEAGDHPVFACTGTPVDCVRISLLSDLVPDARIVVSGINRGINLGDDTSYSGTVGAAIEAGLLDACGIAFSQQGDDHAVGLTERGGHDFELAPVAAAMAAAVVRRPPDDGLVLNINLPSRLDRERPMQIARLGRRTYERGSLRPYDLQGDDGALFFEPFAGTPDAPPPHETGPDVDFSAVLAGRISVTSIALGGRLSSGPRHDAWLESIDLAGVVAAAVAALGPAESSGRPARRR